MSKRGACLREPIVALVILLVLVVGILLPALAKVREMNRRSTCQQNLRAIGQALTGYATSARDSFPWLPFGTCGLVGEDKAVKCVRPAGEEDPFRDLPEAADRSVSMNLWLLCRQRLVSPDRFLCPGSPDVDGAVEFTAAKPSASGFVNFPWKKTGQTISYSFLQPWSRFSDNHSSGEMWSLNARPGQVVGADANDGLYPDDEEGKERNDSVYERVNSSNHGRDGENLLCADCSVLFSSNPYHGLYDDNIYTALPADYTGTPGETPGVRSVRPRDQFGPKVNQPNEWDTVLIPVRDADLAEWTREP